MKSLTRYFFCREVRENPAVMIVVMSALLVTSFSAILYAIGASYVFILGLPFGFMEWFRMTNLLFLSLLFPFLAREVCMLVELHPSYKFPRVFNHMIPAFVTMTAIEMFLRP